MKRSIKWLKLTILFLFLLGCSQSESERTFVSLSTTAPAPTLTPSPTATEIPTVLNGREIITAENASQVEELDRLGFGQARELDISPDDSMLAIASTTGIQVYDLATFEYLFGNTNNWSNGVDWSPDGSLLVSAHADGSVKLWDVSGGEVVSSWNAHKGEASSVAWSPDGQMIASRQSEVDVKIWDAKTFDMLYEHQARYGYGMAWTSDSQNVILHSDINPASIVVFREEIGFINDAYADEIAAVAGDDYFVNGANTGAIIVAFSNEGQEIISGDGSTQSFFRIEDDTFLYVDGPGLMKYSVKSKRMDLLLEHDEARFSRLIDWSISQNIFVSGGIHGEIAVVDLSTGDTLGSFPGYRCCIEQLTWSPNQDQIAFSKHTSDQNVFIWEVSENVASPGVSAFFERTSFYDNQSWSYSHGVGSLIWNDDNHLLVSSGRGRVPNNGVAVWDGEQGDMILELNSTNFGLRKFSITQLSPNGSYLAAIHSSSKSLFIFEVESRSIIHLQEIEICNSYSVSWSFDSTKLIIGNCDESASVGIWAVSEDEVLSLFSVIERYKQWRGQVKPRVYYLSPDGNWLAGVSRGGDIWVLNAITGREEMFEASSDSYIYQGPDIAWSPAQPLLAYPNSNGLIIWNAETQQEVAVLSGFSGGMEDIVWSPDGTQIATIGEDDTIRIWGIP